MGKEGGRERAPSPLPGHPLAGRQCLSCPLRTLVETVLVREWVSKKSNNTAGHLRGGLLSAWEGGILFLMGRGAEILKFVSMEPGDPQTLPTVLVTQGALSGWPWKEQGFEEGGIL